MIALLCAAAAGPAAAQGDPQTSVILDSEPGDSLGLGGQWSYPADGGPIQAQVLQSGPGAAVNVTVADWSLSFARAGGDPLVAGTYDDAIAFTPFYEQHSIEVRRGSSTCGEVQGRFEVLSISYAADGSLASAAIDFEHHCDRADAALRGEVRINVPAAGSVPPPGAQLPPPAGAGTPAPALLLPLLLGGLWRRAVAGIP